MRNMRKRIDSRRILDSYTKVDRVVVSDGTKEFSMEVVNKPDAVAAIIFNEKKLQYVFVKQYRAPIDGYMFEVVAGKIDNDENPDDAMIREILEETGYKVDSLKVIMPFYYTSPGYTNERIQIYFVTVSEMIEDGGGVNSENEETEVVVMPKYEIDYAMLHNKISDGKTIIAWYAHSVNDVVKK